MLCHYVGKSCGYKHCNAGDMFPFEHLFKGLYEFKDGNATTLPYFVVISSGQVEIYSS